MVAGRAALGLCRRQRLGHAPAVARGREAPLGSSQENGKGQEAGVPDSSAHEVPHPWSRRSKLRIPRKLESRTPRMQLRENAQRCNLPEDALRPACIPEPILLERHEVDLGGTAHRAGLLRALGRRQGTAGGAAGAGE